MATAMEEADERVGAALAKTNLKQKREDTRTRLNELLEEEEEGRVRLCRRRKRTMLMLMTAVDWN